MVAAAFVKRGGIAWHDECSGVRHSAGGQPMSPTVPARETTTTSTWRGVVCPRCGGMAAEGHVVVLCPKCSSPNHVECWRDHGGTCGACGTAAEIGDPPREAVPLGILTTDR